MSNAIPQAPADLAAAPAANADDIGARSEAESPPMDSTGGWDAYDVWRRFIKEARERRRNAPSTD